MTDARDHFYIGRCMTCDWWEEYSRAPFKAKKETRSHAKRRRMHQTCVIDVTELSVIAKYEFAQRSLFSDMDDEPPF